MNEDIDREIYFSNEKFVLGVLQVASAAIISGSIAQLHFISNLSGLFIAKFLITTSTLSLIFAVFGTFAKYKYKECDIKRRNEFARWLKIMRVCVLTSTLLLCLGLLSFIIAIWTYGGSRPLI